MTQRILIVASKYLPEYTGAAHRLHTLYSALKKAPDFAYDVSVLCGGIEKTDNENYEIDGIPITRIKSRGENPPKIASYYRNFISAYRALKKRNPDLIHVIGTSAVTAAAYYYAWAYKKPLIWEMVTAGAEPKPKLPLLGKVWAPLKKTQTVIVAISEPLGKKCEQQDLQDIAWQRPNPVDTERFFPNAKNKQKLRRAITNFQENDIVISMVAKFMPQKNQIFLIDVLKHLPEHYKLLLAGPKVSDGALAERDRSYFENIVHNIQSNDLTERVQILDHFIESPQDIMVLSDFYAMPNYDEGLGTPLLEAQACAIPVIANAQEPAFAPHIEDGKTGYLAPLNAQKWAEIIQGAAPNPSDLQRRANTIKDHYSLARMADIYHTLFDTLSASNQDQSVSIDSILKRAKP